MKMSKYLNKRILICLSVVVLLLIMVSFVASSVDAQREKAEDPINDDITQWPETVRRGENVTFWGYIIQPPKLPYTGEKYCFEIVDPNGAIIKGYPIEFDIADKEKISIDESWKVPKDPVEAPVGQYRGTITFPCSIDPRFSNNYFFNVVDTLLVIQKFNDTNRNYEIDTRDDGLPWEFKVTDPKGKTTTHFTNTNGEIRIEIDKKLEGDYKITEIIKEPDKWELIKKDTKAPIVEEGKQWIKIFVEAGKESKVTFLNNFSLPPTKLIIRKFDDTNRNGRIDGGDERLQGWEFKVTDPGGNTKLYTTTNKREIVINVPPEYAGKVYTVEEILQPGWKSILPSKQTVNVPAGRTTTVQFLNAKTLLIIQKFGDSNRNSKIDSNDAKLQGWKFKVTDPSRRTTSYLTNSRGEIIIKVPGEYAGKEYIIEETLLPLWESVLPIEQPVHVNVLSDKTTSVQFLNKKNDTQLIIQKFSDSNQNNEVDDGTDERLQGWNFSVMDPAGTTTTYTTDGDGTIKIEDVPEGDYSITEIIDAPDDWKLIKIATKAPIKEEGEQGIKIFVEEGKESIVQFLNNVTITRLRIQKFEDSNRNGEVDSEDEVLQGWNFTVTDPAGTTTTNITNNRGEIIIGVPEEYVNKDYTVEEKLKTGWKAILPKKQTVKVPKGKTTTVQFLNNESGTTLIILKFSDTNQNGKVDSEDERLQGWNFNVTDPAGKTTTHITNDIGEIEIEVPREYEGKGYIVKETLKPDWVAVLPIEQRVNVPKGKTTTVNFLNGGNGDLTIIKFYDPNQNKVQNLGEQGLAWNFSITFPDGSVRRVTTAANGLYTLHNIPVGGYTIREESRGCRWTSSTGTTQEVDVSAGKEATAIFGNYLPCSVPPGCPWFSVDKNLNVSKSVNPCSVVLGKEEEVTVHLRICVDPKHILNGTKVRNISVIETLHNYFSVVNGSFSVEPSSKPRTNPDGTTTIRWNISSLCCEEWHVSFNVTATFALPIDVTESYGVASMVMYDDPDSEETKVVKELPIPAGKLLFVLPTPTPTPTATSTPTPEPPGFEALLAIAGLLAVAYMMWRRKR